MKFNLFPRALYRFPINRLLIIFLSSSTLLVAVYLAFNISVTRNMEATVNSSIIHSGIHSGLRSLQAGLFRLERNIQQYQQGLIRLSRQRLQQDCLVLHSRAVNLKGSFSQNDYGNNGMDKITVVARHIKLLASNITRLQQGINNPALMRKLQESFFLCDHLLTGTAVTVNRLDLDARRKLQNSTTQLYLQLVLLLTVAALLIVSALLLRRVLRHKLELFSRALKIEPKADKRFKVMPVYPYRDEFAPVISDYRSMAASVTSHLQEIRYLKNYLRNIIESMPSLLISVDNDLNVTHWNSSAAQTTGIPAAEALGKPVFKLLPGAKQYERLFEQVLDKREPVELSRQLDTARPGAVYNVSAFPLVANGVRGMVLRLDDVTEAEQKDAQLRRAQKMETIGNLAGGLAHDFNNILAIIVGTLSLIKHQLNNNQLELDSLHQFVDVMDDSAQRASDMVEQLLTLSRKQEMSLAPVDLNLTVKHVIKLCRNSLSKTVTFAFTPYPKKAVTKADPAQLEQVVLNLCINAAHAMTFMRPGERLQGGEVQLSIERIEPDPIVSRELIHGRERPYWLLSVKDSGVGIPPDDLERIFEPFFTTKEHNGGTGLGLSMVYSIIKQHNGHINVYSEPGMGSSFNIYLPCSDEPVSGPAKPRKDELPAGYGTILVVDDEPVMRQMAQSMLEECNYKVVCAENGYQAVEEFSKNLKNLRLVLLDLVMPGISGLETYRRIAEISDRIPVLMSSGFKKDERVKEALDSGVKDFVAKPYTLQRLGEALRRILHD